MDSGVRERLLLSDLVLVRNNGVHVTLLFFVFPYIFGLVSDATGATTAPVITRRYDIKVSQLIKLQSCNRDFDPQDHPIVIFLVQRARQACQYDVPARRLNAL